MDLSDGPVSHSMSLQSSEMRAYILEYHPAGEPLPTVRARWGVLIL